MGYDGAPISVVITYTLLPIGIVIYVYFIAGRECWGGFSKQAFKNWYPMLRLGGPGMVALLAEYCAFEILTLVSSYISTTALAAQSVQIMIEATLYQIGFSISVAGSTRIGNLIGASFHQSAKLATQVTLAVSAVIGLFNMALLILLRHKLPYLFNSEPGVV